MSVHHVAEIELEPDPLDPSQILSGEPVASVRVLDDRDGVERGVWELTPGVVTDVEADEMFVVLAGRATIEVQGVRTSEGERTSEGGPTFEVGPGDVVILQQGWRTRWTVHETLRKVYQATTR